MLLLEPVFLNMLSYQMLGRKNLPLICWLDCKACTIHFYSLIIKM